MRRGHEPETGRWSLPGGRLEPGEAVPDAVVREVREETGLDVACGSLVGWAERRGPEYHFVILDFAVTVLGGSLRAGGDATEAAWVPAGEVAAMELVGGLAAFLADHGVIDGRSSDDPGDAGTP